MLKLVFLFPEILNVFIFAQICKWYNTVTIGMDSLYMCTTHYITTEICFVKSNYIVNWNLNQIWLASVLHDWVCQDSWRIIMNISSFSILKCASMLLNHSNRYMLCNNTDWFHATNFFLFHNILVFLPCYVAFYYQIFNNIIVIKLAHQN